MQVFILFLDALFLFQYLLVADDKSWTVESGLSHFYSDTALSSKLLSNHISPCDYLIWAWQFCLGHKAYLLFVDTTVLNMFALLQMHVP